ncbi:methyltransferase domain-containing protein [Nitrospirales bacterium NOB]|nr:MAG: methyltransferase domain-containing protein [bacterium]KXJ99320.1 MAG: putative methyltransferase [Nitrospira sp. OLB3]MBV6468287.1 Ubiquinone/menaquinone biosynthesis C-methyltransferase UbiE [Nitrospirota bacterium]MCE7963804.1 methyltransferase domain-containing protein [Nitrospira sp. NTP2]MCK6498017.1 methyltransferase domain-containing protein [Nitrospira sp.]MDL1888629.1 methyltransferase domain-containing protein [Nitrospirales bacterium NOB]MEB2337535.1 methyltransferase doma
MEYVFQTVEERRELERLHLIERMFDPGTQRRMLATGLTTGWHCLEVGAGAGSIVRWLQQRVGPSGRVVAVDTNPRFLRGGVDSAVEIVSGDICEVDLQPAAFDLVHARYVLIHVADYQKAFERMLRCVKPGGWVMVEEPDFQAARAVTGSDEARGSFARVSAAIEQMFLTLGMDHALGAKLPVLFQRHDLSQLTVEHEGHLSSGGQPVAQVMKLSAEQLRDKYLATGRVTGEDIDRYCRCADDPEVWSIYYATVAVTGWWQPQCGGMS